MDNTKKVCYYQGEAVKDTKELTWPQKYEDFIKDIIQNFDLTNKNILVILKVVTDDGDENNINSQEDLEEYLEDDNIKEFKFSIEENKDSGGKQNQGPINIKELEKLLDPNLLKEEEDLDVDNILKEMFDKDEYKKKKEEEENKYSDIFNQSLEKSMEEILIQQSKTMEEEINKKLNNYSELFVQDQKEAYNSIMDIKDNLANIKDQTEEMSGAIKELRDSIQNNQLVLASYQKINQIKVKKYNNNNNNNNNNNLHMSEINNNNNFANPLDNIMNEREEDEISIKFEKRKMEITRDVKEAKFLNINDIRMTNEGIHSYKNLCFVKDEENSSEEINFFGHNKHTDIFELTMAGEFEPNSNANINITVAINNPKPEQIYKMFIYVREKSSNKNLSEPLEINVKTKQAEDPIQQRQKRAEAIYEDLKNEFRDYENLVDKNEIIEQLLENDLDKEAIKKSLNAKIQEIKEKQNKEKSEQIFKELEFYGFNFCKEQMISLIKEKNFNKENVQNYINERISEQIYDNLSKSDDADFKNNSKEDVLNKIKELNFNVDGIKEVYKKGKLVDPIVNPANEGVNEGGNGDDEEVDKLYQELEDEYGISGFIEEEAAKAKIRELNCDRDQIVDWIENNLLNGDN
jgi:hypothetical protein